MEIDVPGERLLAAVEGAGLVELPVEEDDWRLAQARALECDVRLLEGALYEVTAVVDRYQGSMLGGEASLFKARMSRARDEAAEEARRLRKESLMLHAPA